MKVPEEKSAFVLRHGAGPTKVRGVCRATTPPDSVQRVVPTDLEIIILSRGKKEQEWLSVRAPGLENAAGASAAQPRIGKMSAHLGS